MKCYLIYSERTIWITDNPEDKDSGYSIKYESLDEMIQEFRNDLRFGEYDYVDLICEETSDSYVEMTKKEALNLI